MLLVAGEDFSCFFSPFCLLCPASASRPRFFAFRFPVAADRPSMLTVAVAEAEEACTSSKQAWHVQSLEATELAAEGGPRLPQPMHKRQAETRVEVRMGKSVAWRIGAAVAMVGLVVVGPASPFCCSSGADAGRMAVADEHSRSGGSSSVCAGASWSGALEEGKPFAGAT